MSSLSRQGYSIKKDRYTQNEIENIKKELTVEVANHMFDHLESKKYHLYRENANKLYVPKYYGLQKFNAPERNVIGLGECRPNMIFVGELRDYQVKQVDAFIEACNNPLKMGGIVSIQCGGGKTVIAISIACQLKLKTLFMSHKDFLNVQFTERVKMFAPTASIGIIKQSKIDIEDKDFVVGSLQSIAMRDYDPNIFKDFGLVIIDEVHHCSAEVFSNALVKSCSPYTLGLSATLNRKDGLRKVFEWFIGKPVIKPTKCVEDNNVIVEFNFFNDNNPQYCNIETMFNNKINAVAMLSNVVKYKPRTVFIVENILKYMDDTKKMLILSERKSLLSDIDNLLNEIPDFKYTRGFYIGGMSQKKLDESCRKDILLGSCSMINEGFDLPDLNTLLFASPLSCIEQAVGRILRKKPEDRTVTPLIIDIIDNFSIFAGRFNKRKSYYTSKKYQIVTS